MGWITGLPGIAKLAIILAIITALIGAAHWYNQGLVDQGKAEVMLDWAEANEEQAERWAAERNKLERAKVAMAKRYHDEVAARRAAQAVLDREREDAIKNSAAASAVCFDDRMRDAWARDSGHGGPATGGEAGRGVAPTVR